MELKKEDCKEFVGKRDVNSNKGDFGYIAILGGCQNYSGAIKLANLSSASIRAGSGVTRLIIPKSIVNSVSPYLLESTLFTINDNDGEMIFDSKEIDESLHHINALAIGIGWGINKNNEKILEYILENYSMPIVIDADGINTLSKMDLEILNRTKSQIILTPHPKEFERISNISMDEIKQNPVKVAEDFANKYNLILLLKGHETVVTDGSETYTVKKGGAGMATAGSGDVLSGIIVGMLGSNKPSPHLIATCAYIAGLAGEIAEEKYTDISMKASDTIESIPEAIKEIRN